MSPSELMRADECERALLSAAAERAFHYRTILDRNLARMIIAEWVEVEKKRQRHR